LLYPEMISLDFLGKFSLGKEENQGGIIGWKLVR
jgi:hypothetical protein